MDFLYSRVNYETFHKIPCSDLSMNLRRMQVLLDKLNNPERELKIVHIAGTKGKGSTCIMLSAMASAAGYNVGLFTSPHILNIEERIQFNGVPCGEEDFTRWAKRVEPVVLSMDAHAPKLGAVTFFEITTAMAFLAFQERNVDLAVLETGLGGRLDSTNVCQPLATAITSIGIDHVAVLGDTEEKIAKEKAGIIKSVYGLRVTRNEELTTLNSNELTSHASSCTQQAPPFPIPVVLGRMHDGPRQVIEQIALEHSAPVIAADRDFTWTYTPVPNSLTGEISSGEYKNIRLNLPGAHQAGNAAVALQLVQILNQRGFNITESAIRQALDTIHIPGRIDVVCQSPITIIDAAHNPDSISQLAAAIKRLNLPREDCVLIFACADDKDAAEMFKLLYDYFGTWLITKFSNNPRACNPNRLKEIFNQTQKRLKEQGSVYNNTVEIYEHSNEAILSSQNKTNRRLICIAGSFYLASEAYKLLQ